MVLESAIENYLKSTIEALGGTCLKFGPPGIRGYPDRLCKLPNGSAFFVEVKRPKGGRLAELQRIRRAELEAVNWRVYVVKNKEEINECIEQERRIA